VTNSVSITISLGPEQLEAMAQRVAEILSERAQPALPELLTVGEAAALLRCRPKRVYTMASDGRLERVKDGGRLLIPREAVERHLLGNSVPSLLDRDDERVAA